MNVKLYLKDKTGEYINIPLYGDESIRYQSKISDAEDLETVFNDSTNNFSIPATDEANKVFNYWFEIGVEGDFDIKEKVDGYLEINTLPYKYGKVSLTGIDYEKGLPVNYKIEFYGALITLKDRFEEDKLIDLYKLDELDFTYSKDNLIKSLINPDSLKDSNIVTPLFFTTDRNITASGGGDGDITFSSNAIKEDELKYGLKVTKIIEAMEDKYGIKFHSKFLKKVEIERLFLWLNREETNDESLEWKKLIIDGKFSSAVDNYNLACRYNATSEEFIFIRNKDWWDSETTNYNFPANAQVYWQNYLEIELSSSLGNDIDIQVRVRDIDSGEIVGMSDGWIIPNHGKVHMYDTMVFKNGVEHFLNTSRYAVEFKTRIPREIKARVKMNSVASTLYEPFNATVEFKRMENVIKDINISSNLSIRNNLPDMQVSEFFQGIMQAFRLVIIPIDEENFQIETINEYYEEGNIIDITNYIDKESHNTSVRKVFEKLSFKMEDSNQVLQENFERINRRKYGFYTKINPVLKDKKDIEIPFVPIMTSPIDYNQNDFIEVGLMQEFTSSGLQRNQVGNFLFYYNGLRKLDGSPIYINIADEKIPLNIIPVCTIINNENQLQVSNMITWGDEKVSDEVYNDVNLYSNYWKEWVDTLYDKDSRVVTYEGVVDYPLIDKLRLNSKLIVDNQLYNINDFDINLINNNLKITLFPNIFGLRKYREVIERYFINSAKNYGTIDLRGVGRWELSKDYDTEIAWLIDNTITDVVPGQEFTPQPDVYFFGRYYNFFVNNNVFVASNERKVILKFTNIDTGEVSEVEIIQDGILT